MTELLDLSWLTTKSGAVIIAGALLVILFIGARYVDLNRQRRP